MAELLDTARVSPDDVLDIIDTLLTEDQINAFINSANVLVNNKLTNLGLGEDLLAEIEKWLSAHFLAIRDQIPSRERVDKWDATYQGKTDMGLRSTTYGQQALALDYTGTLAALGQQGVVIQVWSEYD